MKIYVAVIFYFSLLEISEQISTPDADDYVAAVLEYQFTRNTSQNLQNYLYYIKKAAEQDADILVFPEMTLTRGTNVKVPIHGLLKEFRVPALHPHLFDHILVSLSQAARQNSIYVVANIQEEMDCNHAPGEYCPEERTYIFNTNVVFDRTGAVIDRYRKINLFGEFTRSPALRPELGVFSTDFGVRFGHFICFDLMFQVPATQVVQKYNLTDIVFSTMWFSEMPFLTAIEIQESYASTMNVNFLAAGANNVKVGSAGSGIYSGRDGALVSIMPGEPKSRLLVTRVPKRPGQASFKFPGPIYDDPTVRETLLLTKDVTLPSEVSRPLRYSFQEFTLVDKDVSCKFTVKIKENSTANAETVPKFRAFVKDGSNRYAQRRVSVVLCAVVACRNDSASSCPYRFTKQEASTEFEELEIKMTTYPNRHNDSLKCDNVVYYPVSLRYNKFPLQQRDFVYSKSSQNDRQLTQCGGLENGIDNSEINGREEILYKIVPPQSELVSFAVWGRIYARDVNPEKSVTEEDVESSIETENFIYSQADNYSTD